ncbi:MAG: hypothetical protein JKX90_00550 [Colwellia sp.]|nr:hypothetical protein [Colwellia sp.]
MGYSLNFRQRVLAYKEENEFTFEKTSEYFNVSLNTLFRWANDVTPCTERKKICNKSGYASTRGRCVVSPR